eukprot:TRINITY_DN87531_c0_g1_i1.p1 TRINITY_DN87531_c0_g1~~TRINITY_DN87531_c0_g1_i1.p1  ORF type:complete len:1020 (-),score=156.89 TRINITY_DN87531_c0_g1_i1:118-2943(-)
MDSTDPSSPNHVSQEKCYELMASRMVGHALAGYHTCLFCYGQTASGKTTTIMGKSRPESEQGLLLRLLGDLYNQVESMRETSAVQCRVQMLEVYNEKIRDLLPAAGACDQKTPEVPCKVHVHPRLGVYVDGATDNPADNVEDCLRLVEAGRSKATVASTAMNHHSSRAHTIFRLFLERHGEDHTVVASEVYFVDLAGRENEKTTKVTGDHFIELTFINRSLMWLASCIQALGQKANRARIHSNDQNDDPASDALSTSNRAKFRNSKLTLLLSNALTGNSKTSMIGTLSPARACLDESYSTLNFASTVKTIKVQARAAAKIDKDSLIQSLKEELENLRDQVPCASPKSAQDLDSQAEVLNNMKARYEKRWEQAEQKAKELERQKKQVLQNLVASRWKFAKLAVSEKQKTRDLAELQASIGPAHISGATCNGSSHDGPDVFFGQDSLKLQQNDLALWDRALKAREQAVESMERSLGLYNCGHTNPNGTAPWLSQQAWHSSPHAGTSSWPAVPSLVLHSKDPSFSGKLIIHPTKRGRPYSIGCDPSSDFVLPEGAGISPATCTLWQDDGKLFIQPTHIVLLPSSIIEINGIRLVRPDAKELRHGDFVGIGASFRFFAFTRSDDGIQSLLLSASPGDVTSTSCVSDIALMETILGPERAQLPGELKRAERYTAVLEHENDITNSKAATRKFLMAAHKVRQMVDEANSITSDLKPGGRTDLHFILLSVSPPLAFGTSMGCPELCVRAVRLKQQLQGTSVEDEVCIWTLAQFQERLVRMRRAHADWKLDPARFELDLIVNPWSDCSDSSLVAEYLHKVEECAQLQEQLHMIETLATKSRLATAPPSPLKMPAPPLSGRGSPAAQSQVACAAATAGRAVPSLPTSPLRPHCPSPVCTGSGWAAPPTHSPAAGSNSATCLLLGYQPAVPLSSRQSVMLPVSPVPSLWTT